MALVSTESEPCININREIHTLMYIKWHNRIIHEHFGHGDRYDEQQ